MKSLNRLLFAVVLSAASIAVSVAHAETATVYEPIVSETDYGMVNVDWHAPAEPVKATVADEQDDYNYQSDIGNENFSWTAPKDDGKTVATAKSAKTVAAK